MKNLYTAIFSMLLFITSQAQTVDFSIAFIGTNSATGNYQMAFIATPSSMITSANTDDMVAGFYVPTGVTLGNFVIGDSGIPTSDWTSNALGSNANGDAYYLARVEAGSMGTILNGDGPFQLVLFDIIADTNPTSGSITFIENGDPIFDPFFLENYMNVNGGNNIYNQNNPTANAVSFETLSVPNEIALATDIAIYPNPSHGIVNINSKHIIDTVDVFSILGYKVAEFKTSTQLDLSQLTSGIYLLKIIAEGKTTTKKIVIK